VYEFEKIGGGGKKRLSSPSKGGTRKVRFENRRQKSAGRKETSGKKNHLKTAEARQAAMNRPRKKAEGGLKPPLS